jgi:hypothetical protein
MHNYFKATELYPISYFEGINANLKLMLKRSYSFHAKNAYEAPLHQALENYPNLLFPKDFFKSLKHDSSYSIKHCLHALALMFKLS